jgi:hypothetical protein
LIHAFIVSPDTAAAQSRTVGAAGGLSLRNEGRSDRPYLGPGYGGSARSVIAFFTADVRDAVAVGVELMVPGTISGMQQERVSSGENRVLSTHRDVLMLGVASVNARYVTGVHVAGVLGGGAAIRHTSRVGQFRSYNNPAVPSPVSYSLTNVVPVVGGGPNVTFAVNNRIGIVGLWRLHYLLDTDLDGSTRRGVSSFIATWAVGAQVMF